MAWPPPTLPTNRTDATPQGGGVHAGDHNAVNLAVNDTVAKLRGITDNPGAYYWVAGVGGYLQNGQSLGDIWIPGAPFRRMAIIQCHYVFYIQAVAQWFDVILDKYDDSGRHTVNAWRVNNTQAVVNFTTVSFTVVTDINNTTDNLVRCSLSGFDNSNVVSLAGGTDPSYSKMAVWLVKG